MRDTHWHAWASQAIDPVGKNTMLSVILLAASMQAASPWTVIDETSQLDGRRSYTAGVESTNNVSDMAGYPNKAMLAVSCENGYRRVVVAWPRYLGRDETRVSWKFDDGEIQRRVFEIPTGGRSAFLSGRSADRFLDELATAGRVVMQVGGTSEAVFETPGASQYVDTVKAACPVR